MKKILWAAPLFAAIAVVASCSADRAKVEQINPVDLSVKIRNCTSDDSLKLYVAAAKDYAARLASENKLDSARLYLDAVIPEVKKKNPSLAESFKSVEGVIAGAAGQVAEKVDSVADKGGEKLDSAAAKGKQAVKDAAEATADKARELTDKAVDAGKDVVKKVGDVADEGAEKARELLGK